MRKVIRKFIVWAMGASAREEAIKASCAPIMTHEGNSTNLDPKIRISFLKAMNGSIIEVSSYKQNPHGPDWKHELYIVREGENLGDAIKVILATKALEQ
jgi:hypothetical protein